MNKETHKLDNSTPLTPQTAKSHGLSQPLFESWTGQRATLSKLRGKQILCKPWWVQRITFNPPTRVLKQSSHILLLTNQNHFKLTKNINSNFQIQKFAFAISHHFRIHHECTHFNQSISSFIKISYRINCNFWSPDFKTFDFGPFNF